MIFSPSQNHHALGPDFILRQLSGLMAGVELYGRLEN